MDTIKIKKKKTLMIAHRGLSSLEKENTACSFVASGNRSYYGCECDIHPTTDGFYMIAHDDNLKRVSGIDTCITSNTKEDLYKIRLIDNFDKEAKPYYQVLLLEDYIKIMKRYDKVGVIEFKEDLSKEQVQEVINIVKSLDYINNVSFISFHKNPLVYAKEIVPNNEVEYLVSEFNDEVFSFCEKYHIGLDADYHCLSKEIIKRYHSINLKVNAWTVNDKEVAKMLVKNHIDFITTNNLE